MFVFRQVDSWLPPGIRSTDIDAAIERAGHFLWFEFKCSVVAPDLKRGQAIFWEQAIKMSGERGHLIIAEHPDLVGRDLDDPLLSVETIRVMYYDAATGKVRMTKRIPANQTLMRWLVGAWLEHTKATQGVSEFSNFIVQNAIAG